MDIIARNLRRGELANQQKDQIIVSLSLSPPPSVQGRERCELIQLSTLLVVQFGTEHPDVSSALKPTVTQLATDHTVAVQERAKVCVGVYCPVCWYDLWLAMNLCCRNYWPYNLLSGFRQNNEILNHHRLILDRQISLCSINCLL